MKAFRYLPHTADVRFRAYGKDFKGAIENSALALLSTMLDVKKIGRKKSATSSLQINETADTPEELVWFILQDILSKVDSRKLNAYAFKVSSLKESEKISLKGRLLYKKTGADNALLSVKAVTPHGLKVVCSKKGCSIEVVVDV